MPDSIARQDGVALIITVLVLALLFALGTGLLATATVESTISVNERWSEGAFYAAEAAVQASIDQIAQGTTDQPVDLTELGDGYTFRSGGRDATDPEPPLLVGTVAAEGYSLGESSGYSGTSVNWVFEIYQINGTGMGPQNATREIEVQVAVGPIAQ
jgi:Tfp pilus assembly protein PilX